MVTDRFVTVHLNMEKERILPTFTELPELLETWGLTTRAQETLWVISFDSIEQIRTVAEVAQGNYHRMEIPIPAVLSAVFLSGTDRFCIAHNHPSGDISPTVNDLHLTNVLMTAANACGLYFEDHLIVGPNGKRYSFVDGGLLIRSDELATLAKNGARVVKNKV